MIRAELHNQQVGFREVAIADVSELVRDPGNVLWVDVQDPGEADLAQLQEEFGFHELAVEDALRRRQRPKVDEYEGHYFVVFYAVAADGRRALRLEEVHLFLGSNYLISLHHGPVAALAEAGERWHLHQSDRRSGVGVLVYCVLDSIVDSYFPILDRVAERADHLEERVFQQPDRETLRSLFRLRKDLLALRRVLAPEREVLNRLLRDDQPLFGAGVLPYLQDVYDHVLRILDSVDLYRDLLASTLEAHLAATSNSLNQIMKRLTALTVLLMVPTLIAGIYGMNFQHMPELGWPAGYYTVLAIMVVLAAGLALLFRRRGWL